MGVKEDFTEEGTFGSDVPSLWDFYPWAELLPCLHWQIGRFQFEIWACIQWCDFWEEAQLSASYNQSP